MNGLGWRSRGTPHLCAVNVCAQLALYALYFSPEYNVLDVFTRTAIEVTGAALVVIFVFPCGFRCEHSALDRRQRFAAIAVVTGLFFLLSMRAALPLLFIAFLLFNDEIEDLQTNGTMARRFLCGLTRKTILGAIIATTLSLTAIVTYFLAVRDKKEFGRFWSSANNTAAWVDYNAMLALKRHHIDPIVVANFTAGTIVFTAGVVFAHRLRTRAMHTAHFVHAGLWGSVPLVLLVWLLSFFPTISTTAVMRFSAAAHTQTALSVVLVMALAAFLKTMVAAVIIESVKRGIFFSVGISSFIPYAFLNFKIATSGGGVVTTQTVTLVVVIIAVSLLALAFQDHLHGPTESLLCALCARKKQFMTLICAPDACLRYCSHCVSDADNALSQSSTSFQMPHSHLDRGMERDSELRQLTQDTI